MLRNCIDKQPQNDAKFSRLPFSQTTSSILNFLEENLLVFSSDLSSLTISLEDDISRELSRFLQDKAKSTDLIIHFEAQKGVDFLITASPCTLNAKPIFVIEAKRLSKTHYDYVKGKNGGIERFKREQEGFDQQLTVSAMLGYVQEETFTYWYRKINTWIEKLVKQSPSSDIRWEQQDLLKEFSPSTAQIARYISTHSRKTQMNIKLHHFWLNMIE